MLKTTNFSKIRTIVKIFLFLFCVGIFMPGFSAVHAEDQYWKDFDVTVEENGPKVTGTAANQKDAFNKFIVKYKGFISGIAAIGAVTMVVLFIKQMIALGASAGNPSARSAALTGCLWTGLAATGLGAAAIIVGIFYKAAN